MRTFCFLVYLPIICLKTVSLSWAEEKVVKIRAGTTARDEIFSTLKERFEKETGYKLDLGGDTKTTGAIDYLTGVLKGEAEAAVSAIDIKDWLKLMKKEGVSDDNLKNMKHHVIGRDMMATLVNKECGVTKLDMAQLSSVYNGGTKTWDKVGGAKIPVKVILIRNKAANNQNFKARALINSDFGGTIESVDSFEEMIQKVAKTPGATGFGPASIAKGLPSSAIVLETLPIGRPITLVYKGEASKGLQALLQFLSKESRGTEKAKKE